MGSYDAPCIRSLLQLMESQSKETIARWCLGYAEAEILPIFEKRCPGICGPAGHWRLPGPGFQAL